MTDTTPNNKAALYRKIATISGAVEGAAKDGRNKDQGYTYITPASVMSAIKPHMAAQHLAIVPHLVGFETIETGVTSRSGSAYTINRVSMHYHLLDGDTGEEMVVPWQAQAGTYGDDKGLAKAQTIALRTFLIQLFQIPAEDPETDPDHRDAQPPQNEGRKPPRNTPTKPQASMPVLATQAQRDELRKLTSVLGYGKQQVTEIFAQFDVDPKALTQEGAAKVIQAMTQWAEEDARAASTPPAQAPLSDEYDDIDPPAAKNGAVAGVTK